MSGFKFVKDRSGRSGLERFHVDAAHSSILAPGDVVDMTGTAHTDGVNEVDAAGAGGDFTGVIVSVEPDYANETLNEQGLPASTAGYVIVNTSPEAIYEVDGDGTNALPMTAVGLQYDIVATAATRSGGVTKSNMVLDTSSGGTGTAQFRVVGIVDGDTTTSQRIRVMPIEIHSKNVTGAQNEYYY